MEPPEHRRWMYNRNYPNRRGLREDFVQGVDGFIDYTMSLSPFLLEGTIRCPCVKCQCMKFLKPEDVKLHLYKKGFEDNYYFWTAHGEIRPSMDVNYQNFTIEEAFQKKSAKVKGVRASEKGSPLHNEGLVTVRTQRKRLAYMRPVSCDEVLQETHTKKKKDGKKNEYKKGLEEYTQNESIGDQDGPSKRLSDNVDISIKVVGDIHKERTYDVESECSFTRHSPRLSGASSSSQSLVNEDELEAAQKQLEAMQEQVKMDSLRRQLQKQKERHEAGRLKFAQFEKLFHKVTEMEQQRRWMYKRNYPNCGGLREEFVQGVAGFIDYALSLSQFCDEGTIRCPCKKCKCKKLLKPEDIKLHLYENGFKKKYYFWTAHGEIAPKMGMNFQNFTNEEAFQKKSTKAKGVQASEKGGSLHNDGLATMRPPRRRLAYNEVFQETNTMKKEDEKKDCVELQAKQTYNEYKQNLEEDIQSQSIDDQDGPSNPSDNVDISLKVVGGVHKERAYGVGSECSFSCQLPGSPVASYSSESSVNRGELEATQRKFEAMRKQEEMDSLQRELKEVTEMFEADFLEPERLQKLMHEFTHSFLSDSVSDPDNGGEN